MQPIMTVDPGANGGICVRQPSGRVNCDKIPASLSDKRKLIRGIEDAYPNVEAIIEDVGFHVAGNRAQGSVKLARHVGQIEGILMALDIPVSYVRPQKWMTVFPDRPKSLNIAEKINLKAKYPSYSASQFQRVVDKANARRKKERKAYIKAKVQAAFDVKVYARPDGKPTHTVTDWCADALGILMWAESQ